MRLFIYIFLIVCVPMFCYAQNATITIGRGTDCFGRGACSITIEKSSEHNATFIKKINGAVILRIYRQKLNKATEDKIFGDPITEYNINSLNFRMDEEILFEPVLKLLPASLYSKELDKLKVGVYSTLITTEYIDIKILDE